MPKVAALTNQAGEQTGYLIQCPGCKYGHFFNVEIPGGSDGKQKWEFNGDFERPTFRPSMLVDASRPQSRCHSFVTDGSIQFLDDCWHSLKGQTVPLPDIND